MLPVARRRHGRRPGPGEIVAGARQAAEELGIPVLLVGDPRRLGDIGGLPVLAGRRGHRDARGPGPGGAAQEGLVAGPGRRGGPGRDGVGHGQRRQHRGHHGQRPVPDGPDPGRGPAGHRHADPGAGHHAHRAARRRRQRRVPRRRGWSSSPRWARPSPGSASASPIPGSACCRSARRTRKGTPLVKETHALLAAGRGRSRSASSSATSKAATSCRTSVDVVVTDGFTGNVVLKTLEGGLKFALSAPSSRRSRRPTRSERRRRPARTPWLPLADELDPDTYGGAMLLGVDGVCIISHGSSSARAIVNAVRVAQRRRPRRSRRASCRAAVASGPAPGPQRRSAGGGGARRAGGARSYASAASLTTEERSCPPRPMSNEPRSTASRCSS